MSKQLSDVDAQAVDLMFDQTKLGSDSGVFSLPVSGEVAGRVGAVETVMRLLDEMPDEAAPPGLVERTLRRIEQAGAPDHASQSQLPVSLSEGQSQA